jgi:ceramide glucosyltransferase
MLFHETQQSLSRIREPQNAVLPSAMFSRTGKAKIAARRPLAGRISLNGPWSRTSRKIRLAVGRGISTDPLYYAPEIVAGATLPCLTAAYAASMLDLNVATATLGVAFAWYGPEALLARLNRWHFSWRMPLLFLFRDLMLPVIYIDAWITNEFVWRGNEMTMREEEPSVEQG